MRGRRTRFPALCAAAALAAAGGSAAADDPVVVRAFGDANDPVFGQVAWGAPGPAGDLDGDGHPDLLASVNTEKVRAISGRTGALIREFTSAEPPGNFGAATAFFPDLDGDQVPDVLIGAPGIADARQPAGLVFVFSGATGAELRRGRGSSNRSRFGDVVVSTGDVNGDGVPDFAGAGGGGSNIHPGEVIAFSGADGTVIPHLYLQGGRTDNLGRAMVALGDVNGDGVQDFAVGAPGANRPPDGVAGAPLGKVDLLSGKDGSVLKSRKGKLIAFGYALMPVGDVDRDGVTDVAVTGNTYTEIGIYSGRNLARLGGIPRPAPSGVFYTLGLHSGGGDVDRDGIPELALTYFSSAGWRIEVHSPARALASPLAGALFRVDRPLDDFIETLMVIPDEDGDGTADLLVSSFENNSVKILSVVPSLPESYSFAVPLTREQGQAALDARGTFSVRVASGTTTVVITATAIAAGTTYTAHLEDAPAAGTFTQVGTLELSKKGGSLELTGSGTPPAALGVSSLADLAGRIVEVRDGGGTAVVSAAIPFPGPVPAVKAKLPLVRDPGTTFTAASAAMSLKFTPKTGALKFDVKVKGVPKGTPLLLRIEDPAGSGTFSDAGAFSGTKFTRDTGKGDALPLGASSVGALSGRRVQVVSGSSVVLEGRLP